MRELRPNCELHLLLRRVVDSGRITGNSELIPADPIRAVTSGWPTTRQMTANQSDLPV
jgi:hypothetical protein